MSMSWQVATKNVSRTTSLLWDNGWLDLQSYEGGNNSKTAMLDYLISLLDDCNDFSWSSAKASLAVLLCRMEQGEY